MSSITIHCVRHAQGFHNLTEANHSMPDPSLTPLGKSQCETLSKSFPSHKKITLLIASPLRRTLSTALLSFPSPRPIIALAELQETSDLPCDTGSDLDKLQDEFTSSDVDFTRVPITGWNSKRGEWDPASFAIEARARKARTMIRDLVMETEEFRNGEDVEVVVVTHGGYLHYFTGDWEGAEKYVGTGWLNCETRSYTLTTSSELKETVTSRLNRLGEERPLSEDEQKELRRARERQWQVAGYQSDGESAKL